ncbi:MAG: four helix bundle protein [Rubritalea sp.]|jgi:four helix bundle protein
MDTMNKIQTYEDLIAWQKAHQFALAIYKTTKTFPKEELFGLTSQVRRAAVSVSSNIVEGFNRKSNLEKLRFYNIAVASCEEAHYQLLLAQDLNYTNTETLRNDGREVKRILGGLIKSINVASLPLLLSY